MSDSWVINASPVILLAKAELMDCVADLVGALVIPRPVASEILGRGHADAAARWLQAKGHRFVCEAVSEPESLAGSVIGAGERAVISWAVAHPGFVAVLDDREARLIARRHAVNIQGTVDVVLRLKSAGLITEARPHLSRIRQVGGFIGDELFSEALRRAGEQA